MAENKNISPEEMEEEILENEEINDTAEEETVEEAEEAVAEEPETEKEKGSFFKKKEKKDKKDEKIEELTDRVRWLSLITSGNGQKKRRHRCLRPVQKVS